MQKSIIVSLSLALFTLAAGLLWDQKDVFLISYWGRPHPEVQLYGSQLINMFCMYLTSNTRWSQLFMDIEQKTPPKKEICPVTPMTTVSFIVLEQTPLQTLISLSPFSLSWVFFCFVFRLAALIQKGSSDVVAKTKHYCPYKPRQNECWECIIEKRNAIHLVDIASHFHELVILSQPLLVVSYNRSLGHISSFTVL